MEPFCKEGDFVLSLPYLFSKPRIGQVIVLNDPKGKDHLLLKRIIHINKTDHHFLLWVEGENKEQSFDSRAFGWIPFDSILGRAVMFRKPHGVIHRYS